MLQERMSMHICFFGASVSKQDKDHQTQSKITGYVTQIEKMLSEKGTDNYKISRMAFGSNYIGDAGIVHVHKVVELKPDICIIDWATAGEPDCTNEDVEFVYSELLANDIWPVTVIFPRGDRDQSTIGTSMKLSQFCQRHQLPFLDLTPRFEKATLPQYLRDGVHTTEIGAIEYAKYLITEIENVSVDNKVFSRFKERLPLLYVTRIPLAVPHNQAIPSLSLSLNTSSGEFDIDPPRVKFLMDMKIGPWSSYVDTKKRISSDSPEEFVQTQAIYDRWCFYERPCLKQLCDWLVFPVKKLLFEQTQRQPEFIQNEAQCNYKSLKKMLKPLSFLYAITNVPNLTINCEIGDALFREK